MSTAPTREATSLAKAADLWILSRVARGEVLRSTGRQELYVLLAFVRHVGDRDPATVTSADVQAWVDSLVAPLRPATRRDYLAILRRFFDGLTDADVADVNPTRGVRWERASDGPPRPRRRGPTPIPTSEVVARFLAHLHRRGLRDSTIESRRRTLTKLEHALDGRGLLEAENDDLVAFVDRLGFASIEARRNDTGALRVFYRWALTEELIASDPTLRLASPRTRRGLPRPMPSADVDRVLAAATERPLRQWMRLAAFCGLRAFEIAQVRREEIIERPGQAPVLIVTNGKGGHTRVVALADEVLDALLDPELPTVGWLFPRQDPPAGPITAGQVSRRCNRFLHDLGIAHTLHSLRHFFGSELYAQTRDLRLTQQLLGHGSPVTTSLYTAVDGDDIAGAVTELPARWRARGT